VLLENIERWDHTKNARDVAQQTVHNRYETAIKTTLPLLTEEEIALFRVMPQFGTIKQIRDNLQKAQGLRKRFEDQAGGRRSRHRHRPRRSRHRHRPRRTRKLSRS
jgi:hypothetical protein